MYTQEPNTLSVNERNNSLKNRSTREDDDDVDDNDGVEICLEGKNWKQKSSNCFGVLSFSSLNWVSTEEKRKFRYKMKSVFRHTHTQTTKLHYLEGKCGTCSANSPIYCCFSHFFFPSICVSYRSPVNFHHVHSAITFWFDNEQFGAAKRRNGNLFSRFYSVW